MTDENGSVLEAIKVRVENLHELAGHQPAAPAAPAVHCRPYTVVLTAADPVDQILDRNDKRLYALVQAGGFDVVINNSKSEALAAANQVSGLPNPVGMVLSSGNTQPTKVPGGEAWYAAAAQYPAQITVLCVERGD